MSSEHSGTASVLVVGGGIIGLSVAWRLAQYGWAVTLCEKGQIGREASWAAAGMLSPGGEFTSASELANLAIESRGVYSSFVRELESITGKSIDYQECGALELAYTAEELASLEFKAAAQAKMGIPSKPVAPSRIGAFWPRLGVKGLHGARFYQQDGLVDPRDLSAALERACRLANVTIKEQCAVFRLEVTDATVEAVCAKDVRRYDAAVIAAGAWSASIDVSGTPRLPETEPVKGQLIGYNQPLQTCNTILRHGHYYLVQRASGLLVVGASMERVGFDRQLSTDVTARLAHVAGRILPHLAETTPESSWIGFRPGSESPWIGAWHSPRLHLAYGHFRNGILLAPVTAQRVVGGITSSLGTRLDARV